MLEQRKIGPYGTELENTFCQGLVAATAQVAESCTEGGTGGIVGRAVAAAEALGVNYRTMMACYESRRMRQALE